MTTSPDPVDDALSSLRTSTPPPSAYASLIAAHDAAAPKRAPTWRRRPATRTLALTGALLAVAGTATAAVTTSGPFSALETSATTDAPAAQNLGVLLEALDNLPAAGNSGAAASGTDSTAGRALAGSGPIRGTTVTRDGISVDIALNDTRICLGTAGPRTQTAAPSPGAGRLDTERALPSSATVPRATDPAALACFPRSAANETLPSISGRDADRVWLTTVVPDGIEDLTVTAAGGQTATPMVTDNVAIASIPGADTIRTLSWTTPDGTKATQDLSVAPGAAVPTVRRLEPR